MLVALGVILALGRSGQALKYAPEEPPAPCFTIGEVEAQSGVPKDIESWVAIVNYVGFVIRGHRLLNTTGRSRLAASRFCEHGLCFERTLLFGAGGNPCRAVASAKVEVQIECIMERIERMERSEALDPTHSFPLGNWCSILYCAVWTWRCVPRMGGPLSGGP